MLYLSKLFEDITFGYAYQDMDYDAVKKSLKMIMIFKYANDDYFFNEEKILLVSKNRLINSIYPTTERHHPK